MALARLISRGQAGLEAFEVSVEVHLAGGLPGFAITGLPTAAVRESKDRVRAALSTCGVEWPSSRITVHLGPADIPKDGGRFDLPIALGILQAQKGKAWQLESTELIGELSLSGDLRPVTGAVPATLASAAAGRRLIVPEANAAEVSLVPNAEAYAARHLLEVVADLDGERPLDRIAPRPVAALPASGPSIDDVRGHAGAKRALAVAAAGFHNLLMVGPPGSGKSMLASRLLGLLPPLTDDELLSVASIGSVAGTQAWLEAGRRRPFRSPHHTTSAPALVGGGVRPRPGEVSLAHLGVLFLDELPEFSRPALEALREPLEAGRVTISRLGHRIDFPARFQLVAAMNPCPCGFHGDGTERCRCSPFQLARYRQRISGPLLDRFDLHIVVPQVPYDALAAAPAVHEREAIERAIESARQRQLIRGSPNALLGERAVWEQVRLGREARRLLAEAQRRWRLSARSIVRILKVTRTVADLAGLDEPDVPQLSEALQLRCFDRPLGIDTV
jgi:magnesium chelatase family protein